VGGTTLQVAGPVAAFLPAAFGLFLAAVVIATTPTLRGNERRGRGGSAGGLLPALRYLRREPVVFGVTLLGTLSGASLFAYSALLPAFTRDELGGGAATLGLLSGAGGVGSIGGALAMDALGKRFGRGRVVVGMFTLSGVAVGALGFTQLLPVAFALVATITFLSIVFGGTAQLLVQTVPPPNLRAGVVAIYTFAFYCILPLGTATVGRLADVVGVTPVFLGMTVLTLVGAALILLFDRRVLTTANLPAEPAADREAAPAVPAGAP
jgi:predicted MFS family arabinose efflux permease